VYEPPPTPPVLVAMQQQTPPSYEDRLKLRLSKEKLPPIQVSVLWCSITVMGPLTRGVHEQLPPETSFDAPSSAKWRRHHPILKAREGAMAAAAAEKSLQEAKALEAEQERKLKEKLHIADEVLTGNRRTLGLQTELSLLQGDAVVTVKGKSGGGKPSGSKRSR
jgi:hypothetical protein